MNTTLPAASWDASAEALLVEGAGLRVHSVFERALNLANAHGELVGLVGPAVGNGPATVVLVALPEPGLGRLSFDRPGVGRQYKLTWRSLGVRPWLESARESGSRPGSTPPSLGGLGGLTRQVASGRCCPTSRRSPDPQDRASRARPSTPSARRPGVPLGLWRIPGAVRMVPACVRPRAGWLAWGPG